MPYSATAGQPSPFNQPTKARISAMVCAIASVDPKYPLACCAPGCFGRRRNRYGGSKVITLNPARLQRLGNIEKGERYSDPGAPGIRTIAGRASQLSVVG